MDPIKLTRAALALRRSVFPFDLFDRAAFQREGSELGLLIASLAEMSLHPPYPWGQWLYAKLLGERGPGLTGDILECGVAMGGMSLLLGTVAQALGKLVYALDSFEGLPPPTPEYDNSYFRQGDYGSRDEPGSLLASFKKAIDHHGLADTITPIKGLFADSLPKLETNKSYCFVHIDADLFESVLTVLNFIYPRIVNGGILAVDDYFHHSQGPARALAKYFSDNKPRPLMHVSFPWAVVIVKGEPLPDGLRRSIDGNRYTLNYLRDDKLFQEVLETSCKRACGAGSSRITAAAVKLRDLLKQGRDDRSSDIYDYLSCMADYWDAYAGQEWPDLREPILM
jgi:hypothetical protein